MQRGAGRKKSIVSYLLHAGFLTYCMTMKMEATCSSETLDDSQQTTWHYIPEDKTLQPSPRLAQHCFRKSQLNALSSPNQKSLMKLELQHQDIYNKNYFT
jgi:hypothetical protein